MDFPVSISNESSWQDISAIEQAISKYLRAQHTWVTTVRLDHSALINHGSLAKRCAITVFGSVDRAALDLFVTDKRITESFTTEVADDLKSLFAHPITVLARITFRNRTDSVAIVPSVQLKPELVSGSKISLDAVWREIINAIASDKNGEFRIDPKTILIEGETRTASTVPRTVEQNGFVFVSKTKIEVEKKHFQRNRIAEIAEEITVVTTTTISRRRKPSSQWADIRVEEQLTPGLGGVIKSPNYAPLHQVILTGIKR